MASKKITAMPDLAGAQVPTDLLTAVDLSEPVATQNVKSTFNDAFAEITKNVTDLSVQWASGDGTFTVSAANKGKLGYSQAAQSFQVSENGGAYQNILKGNGTATRIAFWSAADELADDANLYWDNTNKRLSVGQGSSPSQTVDIKANTGEVNLNLIPTTGTPRVQALVTSAEGQIGTSTAHSFHLIANNTQYVSVDPVSGQVGINFASGMQSQLHIFSATAATPALIARNNTSSGIDIALFQNGTANRFQFKDTGEAVFGLALTATGKLSLANAAGTTITSISSGNAASTLNFIWPVVDPTANQVLSAAAPSGGNVTLSWASQIGPNAPTFSVQINGGGGLFDSNGQFTYDTSTNTVLIGSSSALGSLKFRDTTVANGVTLKVSAPSGNNVYTLPDALPTLNQVLTATAVSGVNVTLGWSTPAASLTINPTDNVMPVRTSATTFGDSNISLVAGVTAVTSSNAAAFSVGAGGNTNPVLRVVGNVASQATGISITGRAVAAGVDITVLTSGTNENLNIVTAGTGQVVFVTGTAAAPRLSFSGDLDTGYDRQGAGIPAMVSDGAYVFTCSLNAGSPKTVVARNCQYSWDSSTTPNSGGSDTGLARHAAAVIRTTDSSTGIGSLLIAPSTGALTGNLTVLPGNAATSTVIDVARFGLNSTGTPAAGLGGRLSFSLSYTGPTLDQESARQDWFITNATNSSRTAAMSWSLVNSATLTEYMRLTTAGGGGTFVSTPGCLALHAGTAPNIWTAGAFAAKLYMIDASGTPATAVAAAFSATAIAGAVYSFLRGRGTNASPAVVQTGDDMGNIEWWAQTNTSTNNVTAGARIRCVATETWAAGANGCGLFFSTSVTGGTIAEKMSLENTGTLRVGASSGSFNTTTKLQVANYASWNTDVTAAIFSGAAGNKALEVIGHASATADLMRVFRDTVTPDLFNISAAIGSRVRAGLGTNAADYAYVGGNLKTNTTGASNVSTTETDLITYSLRANCLGTNGDYVEIEGWGSFSSAVSNKQVRLYFGSTLIFDTTALAFQNDFWYVYAKVVRTGATTQTCVSVFDGDFTLFTDNVAATTANETLSSAVTIKFTGTGGASDEITQTAMTVKWYPNGQ